MLADYLPALREIPMEIAMDRRMIKSAKSLTQGANATPEAFEQRRRAPPHARERHTGARRHRTDEVMATVRTGNTGDGSTT